MREQVEAVGPHVWTEQPNWLLQHRRAEEYVFLCSL